MTFKLFEFRSGREAREKARKHQALLDEMSERLKGCDFIDVVLSADQFYVRMYSGRENCPGRLPHHYFVRGTYEDGGYCDESRFDIEREKDRSFSVKRYDYLPGGKCRTLVPKVLDRKVADEIAYHSAVSFANELGRKTGLEVRDRTAQNMRELLEQFREYKDDLVLRELIGNH